MNLELPRFLFVGIGSNIVNFLVYLLVYSTGVSLFISSFVGYSAGLIVSYHFGRIWIFAHKFNISRKNLILFACVYAIGGLGMSTLIEVLGSTTRMDYRISWFFGALYAAANNFLGLKWFVFNRKNK